MGRDAPYAHAVLNCLRPVGLQMGAPNILRQSVLFIQSRHPQGHELHESVHLRRVVRALLGLLATGQVQSRLEQGQVFYRLCAPAASLATDEPTKVSRPLGLPWSVAGAALVAGCGVTHVVAPSTPRYSYFVQPGQPVPVQLFEDRTELAQPVTPDVFMRSRAWGSAEAVAATDARAGTTVSAALTVASHPEILKAQGGPMGQALPAVSTAVLFSYASSRVGRDASAVLRALVPQLSAARSIRVVGRTDALGLPERNARLATARAVAVAHQLQALGVPPHKIGAEACAQCWLGPAEQEETAAQQRRVDIVVQLDTTRAAPAL